MDLKSNQSAEQSQRLLKAHTKLARTLRSTHYGHQVREYSSDRPPSSVKFAKHVGNNTPFVVRGFASHWPSISERRSDVALARWSNEVLMETLGNREVSVALTGDGRADAVVWMPDEEDEASSASTAVTTFAKTQNTITPRLSASTMEDREIEPRSGRSIFATPYTAQLPFSSALEYLLSTQRHLPVPDTPSHTSFSKPRAQSPIIHNNEATTSCSAPRPIIYLQAQNDCLRSEYPHLLDQLQPDDLHPAWIIDVLGESPEAINLWIGTKHSVSTLHSDPYENIYVVIRGSKTFHITPPGEAWFYSKEWFGTGEWMEQGNNDDIAEDNDSDTAGKDMKIPQVTLKASNDPSAKIPWYPVPHPLHISDELLQRYARLQHRPRPYTVTVHAGDMLYLPRGWLHHVEQEEDEEGLCVAVNSWFEGWDGGMGREWGWGRFMENVDRIVEGRDDEEDDDEDEEDVDGHEDGML